MAVAGLENGYNIWIVSSAGNSMCGWLYSSQSFTASDPGPAKLMASATKKLKLDVYAGSLNKMGHTYVVFDYRCNGGSQGLPRGLIDWNQQQDNWKSAIDYTRQLDSVESNAVGLFRTSFSGGHVVQLAASDKRIKAAISQCPFTSGWASAWCTGIAVAPKLAALGLLGTLFGTNERPVTVSLNAKPGDVAIAALNAPDVLGTFPHNLSPRGIHFKNMSLLVWY